MNSTMRFFQRSTLTQLGPLEQKMMRTLWQCGAATVREMREYGNTELAYTTIMTTLDRLYKKGLLNRSAKGRAFRYVPRYTQAELERAVVGETIRQLLGQVQGSALPLSYLVEAVSKHDASLLDDLQRLLDEKRREMQGKENN